MPFSLFGIPSYSVNLSAISIKFTFLLLVLLLISSVVLHHISITSNRTKKFFPIINFLYFHSNLSMFSLTSYGRFLSYYYSVYSFFSSHILRLVFQVGNVLNILKTNNKNEIWILVWFRPDNSSSKNNRIYRIPNTIHIFVFTAHVELLGLLSSLFAVKFASESNKCDYKFVEWLCLNFNHSFMSTYMFNAYLVYKVIWFFVHYYCRLYHVVSYIAHFIE